MAETIRVLVSGSLGKMGSETVRAVKKSDALELVGAVDVQANKQKIAFITGDEKDQQLLINDLELALDDLKPDVLIDFTNPQAVFENTRTALRKKVHCVVGTTGLSDQELEALDQMAAQAGVGVAVIPNFAIGAILLMKFAEQAAAYMESVEIIELHHDNKVDAPSGTSIKTAEMIAANRKRVPDPIKGEFEKVSGVRGGLVNDVRIHSVRLPGMVAHQEVIFGGLGQALTIRHDSFNRESFMPGVVLTAQKIVECTGLVYGLEKLL